jgi:predicted lipoprotein
MFGAMDSTSDWRIPASLVVAGVSVVILGFLACDDEATAPTNYAPLLHTLTEGVILPRNGDFAARADDLAAAAASLQASADVTSLGKAQTAWRAARGALRSLDAFHFGPVADLAMLDHIDASPADAAQIDALVAATTPLDAASLGSAPATAKGFLGLELLLFAREGDGAALDRLKGSDRRRALARALADDIAASAHQLADAWTVGKGGFAVEVEGAGGASKRYPTQRAAVDDLVGGVGYALELVVAVRLGDPLGLKSGKGPDPASDPTSASDSAAADMTATLSSVEAVYEGQGFSAQLQSRSTALDARVVAQIADCIAKVNAIPKPFASSVTNATATVSAAYDACKTLKATWNTDVTSAIGATLKPPDSDGD